MQITGLAIEVIGMRDWAKTHSAQLKAISEGQDKLLQSHAGLDKRWDDAASDAIDFRSLLLERLEGLRDFMHIQVSHSQHSIEDFQDKYHAELSERLANIEVAFTVRLEALDRKLEAIEQQQQKEFTGVGNILGAIGCQIRANGKHPAGKRK
jgi:hypothetical protein